MVIVASRLDGLYDPRTVVFVPCQAAVVYTRLTFLTPTPPAVTFEVTVTLSLGVGADGLMLGVLILGPLGLGAASATAGMRKRNASARTVPFEIGDMGFP